MKIGILGGSFDPPHIGHYLVVRQILDSRPDIDTIVLMPAYQHQWKPQFTTASDRLAMLSSLVLERTEISDIELKRKGISYTIDSVREVKKKTNAQIYWIIGSDIVPEFHKWEKKEELLKEVEFLVFPRDPFHLPENLPEGFELITDEKLITTNISSTGIRKRLKEGLSITNMVPRQVEEYINKHKLYI